MKIATMGTGGIGGYLAVKLSCSGHKIATIARGKHLEAIKKNGLSLKKREDIETARPWIATDDPKEVGKVDAIILGVKGDSLISAAESCFSLIDKDTVVVPFLNGVEATDRLINILPEKQQLIVQLNLIHSSCESRSEKSVVANLEVLIMIMQQ